ncbi:hypothetical protein [Jannaschia sp. R86511]
MPQGQTAVQAALDALLSTTPQDPDYGNAFLGRGERVLRAHPGDRDGVR